jgi:hypothetical protein
MGSQVAMRRRVTVAFAMGGTSSSAVYVLTGGIGKYGAAKVGVMGEILREFGVSLENMILDPRSNDTLSSILERERLLRRKPNISQLVVCSDQYHMPRCVWLFHMLRIRRQALHCEKKEAVGVIRPPLHNSRWHGVVIGVRKESGEVQFTFDRETSTRLCQWALDVRKARPKIFRGQPYRYEMEPRAKGTDNPRPCTYLDAR